MKYEILEKGIIYDTLRFNFFVKQPKQTAFCTQMGHYDSNIGRDKNDSDTNMELSCQLPPSMEMFIDDLFFVPTIPGLSSSNYYYSFWIGSKMYAEGPISMFPQVGRLSEVVEDNLSPIFMSHPKLLLCQQLFYVTVENFGVNNPIELIVVLRGKISRLIQ